MADYRTWISSMVRRVTEKHGCASRTVKHGRASRTVKHGCASRTVKHGQNDRQSPRKIQEQMDKARELGSPHCQG